MGERGRHLHITTDSTDIVLDPIQVVVSVPVIGTHIVSDTQTITGHTFNPGEEDIEMRSEVKDLGCQKACEKGFETFSFLHPSGNEEGTHTVTLNGPVSGSASDYVNVAASTEVHNDGTSAGYLDQGMRALVVGLFLAAVGACGVGRCGTRTVGST